MITIDAIKKIGFQHGSGCLFIETEVRDHVDDFADDFKTATVFADITDESDEIQKFSFSFGGGRITLDVEDFDQLTETLQTFGFSLV